MPNPIKPRRSWTVGAVPAAGDFLSTNELLINWADGVIYGKNPSTNAVVSHTLGGAGGGVSFVSAPASATASGTAGQIAYDSSYFYVAVAQNTWKRVALSTWASFAAIPVMTSATAPSGVVSDSGILEATTQSWKAFDKAVVSGDTTFYASPSPAPGNWIQYDYGYSVLAGGYAITSRQASPFGSTQAPDGWTLSGSMNGTDFTVIDTRSVPQANWNENGEEKSFALSSPQTYRYWRWTWTSGASTVVIPKIQLTAPA